MASVGSFSGLASGIQWRDMIDQIMDIEAARRVDPLTSQIAAQRARATAWTAYQGTVTKLADAAKALRDGTAFGNYKVSAGTGAGGRALVSATASAAAAPGSHRVKVLDLARPEKLSGHVFESTTAALGLDGEFAVNGRRIAVSATDTLASLRDRINAANTGATPSRVSASILSTGSGAHRLVLTSEVPGAAGIDLVDGATGPLAALGVVSETASANRTESGGTASRRVSSVTTAIATALGVTMPAPSTLRVGDRTISVDLRVDSLSSIAAKITAQGVPARVVEQSTDGRTSYRLEVEATLGTVAGEEAEGARTLEVLGFVQPGRDAVRQVVAGESAWTDAGAAPATGASALVGLDAPGLETELAAGDTISIRGIDGAGAAVSHAFTVGADGSVSDLLRAVEDAFGAGGRPVAASLVDGKLRVEEQVGGESKLAVSLTVRRGETELGTLGRMATETAGRLREVVAGSDAVLEVDGVRVVRGGNTVGDVIAGVTLSLQAADAGSEIDVTVARDDDATVAAVQKFAAAYNEVAAFVKAQTAPGAPLAANGTLRSTMAQLTNSLLTNVGGLPSGAAYSRGALVGVALSRTGTLDVDAAALKAALQTSTADVRALFGTNGTTSAASLEFVASGPRTQPRDYAVEITTPAERAVRTGSDFTGPYEQTGSEDALTVTDGSTGKTVSVALTTGMTADDVVAALNARFGAEGLRLDAAVSGGQLSIAGREYGSAASITVAYAPTVEGAPDPFRIVGTSTGVDVVGRIGEHAATGRGQTLTADAAPDGLPANPAEGIAVRYTGTTAGVAGQASFARGVAGLLAQVTEAITRTGDGAIAVQTGSIDGSIASLERRVTDAEMRLEQRREALTAQFTAMEAAMSRIQAQGNWLTQQLAALQPKQQ